MCQTPPERSGPRRAVGVVLGTRSPPTGPRPTAGHAAGRSLAAWSVSGGGQARPCVAAGVERYNTYRLCGMRDPPSAQSGSDEQMFGAVQQVWRLGYRD